MAGGTNRWDDRDPARARGATAGVPSKRITLAQRTAGGWRRTTPTVEKLWLKRRDHRRCGGGLRGRFGARCRHVSRTTEAIPSCRNLSRLDEYRPKQVTRILDRNNVPIGELGSEKRTVVPYSAIPKMLVQAVVAGEDADYFKHGGVDYMGMRARSSRTCCAGARRRAVRRSRSRSSRPAADARAHEARKVQEIILARRLSRSCRRRRSSRCT
jgi:hypothetical protein